MNDAIYNLFIYMIYLEFDNLYKSYVLELRKLSGMDNCLL